MPQQTSPPSNVVQPRTLVRWLDVNNQNGPLNRAGTYIEIPAFNIPQIWNSASDIIGVFNFQALNNISLADISEVPQAPLYGGAYDPTFLLTVAYAEAINNYWLANGDVVRYKLNHNVGEIGVGGNLYTNQMLKKSFRIEIWSVMNRATAIQTAPIRIYTSVKQNIDYRYADDVALIKPGTLQTQFNCPNLSFPLMFPSLVNYNS